MPGAVTQYRLQLLATGFDPTAALGKDALVPGWNNPHTAKEIETWELQYPKLSNSGVRTRNVPTFDSDILIPEAADAVEELIRCKSDERGTILVRIGLYPKRAIPFRTKKPFAKIRVDYIAPNGSEHHVEFLGDGQQVIVDGTHPDTKRPYTWLGGYRPGSIAWEALPEITEDEARALVGAVTAMLVGEFGFRVKGSKSNGAAGNSQKRQAASNTAAVTDDAIEAEDDPDKLLAMLAPGNVNQVVKRIIPKLLWRGWHPDKVAEYVGAHVMAMAQRHDLPWKNKHIQERRIEIGRIRSAFRNLLLPKYDPTTGEIPRWVAEELQQDFADAIEQGKRPGIDIVGSVWRVVVPELAPAPSELPPLTADQWEARVLPSLDLLMGHWFHTASRGLAAADTGLGKTTLFMGVAAHSGAGVRFLHWRCSRPARVLYIDGEMSQRRFQELIGDTMRRLGRPSPGALFLSRADLPDMPPLNTPPGLPYLIQLIEKIEKESGRLDGIIADNVMALCVGDQKDEISWTGLLPLIAELTTRNIGQIWIDHTGHDTTRGYGSKTKTWRMDTVIHMDAVERAGTDVSFRLSFKKARERSPANRADFQSVSIALINDRWSCDVAVQKQHPPEPGSMEAKYLDILREIFRSGPTVEIGGQRAVRCKVRFEACVRQGVSGSDNRKSRHTLFNRYKAKLASRNMVACDEQEEEELVWLLT